MTTLYAGLMSGTSMGGVDAALVGFYSSSPHFSPYFNTRPTLPAQAENS